MVFDQSAFVKIAVKNVINEGTIGLCLTALMILLFLGNVRATIAVLISIPISVLATFLGLNLGGSSINTMVLGGLALALSRLIDNSVVVLENIFRHMEMGESPAVAAELGGKEVQLAVLAATVSTSIVFFPVLMLYGVSKYLFTALALAVVIALFASYVVAMTVVPLFCSLFITIDPGTEPHHVGAEHDHDTTTGGKKRIRVFRVVVDKFNLAFRRLETWYVEMVGEALEQRRRGRRRDQRCRSSEFCGVSRSLAKHSFRRTDPGQFVVDVKVPAGTRIEVTDDYISKMEQDIRKVVSPEDLNMIVSNIGITPDLSAIYTSNSGMHTAFIQVSLKEDHKTGSYLYMQKVREKLREDFPDVATYLQAGGLVDSVVNQGKPAPIDIQIGGTNLQQADDIARATAAKIRRFNTVNDVLIPQDLDYPGLELNINRERASLLGITPKDIVDNVITALTSDGMIAPSFWVDPKTGNSYMLTVQYPETQIKTLTDFRQIPLRSPNGLNTTPLQSVADITEINTPTEVDHYQLRPVFDIYVMPKSEDLERGQQAGRVGCQSDATSELV